MSESRFRIARPSRLDAFEWWVALVVAAVVTLGLLADSYQRYAIDSWRRDLAMEGLDNQVWGDAFTFFEPDQIAPATARVDSIAAIDDVLVRARDEGTEVVALRGWQGTVENPANGVVVTLGHGFLQQPMDAVAAFGLDWESLGALVAGHAPESGEIALRRSTAAALDVDLGDSILASHPDGAGAMPLTVSGIVRDPASWALGNSLTLYAQSSSYDAIVSWDDSAELSRALRPYPRFLATQARWNGDSPLLADHFDVHRDSAPGVPGRWGPGATEFVYVAGLLAALAGLLAAVVGPRPRRRPLRWLTPLRIVACGAIGALIGAVVAAVLSLVTYAAFGLLMADLVQPRFVLPRPGLYLWWLGVAAALALVLEGIARARGARLWKSRPALAIAAFFRRAAPALPWLAALAGATVLATIAWAWLDPSMVPQSGAPPNGVLVPQVIGLTIVVVSLAALVGRRVGVDGGRPGASMSPLAAGLALIAGVAALSASGMGSDIAGDAAERYDTTSADVAASLGLDGTEVGDILTGFSGMFRTVDTGTMASLAIVLALGTVIALVLAGLGGRTLTWSSRATVAAVGLATTVGAFLLGAVSAALLAAPVDVHDVSSFTDGLQPGAWTTDGALDMAGVVLEATTWVAVATALALALVVAVASVPGRARTRLT